MIDGIISRKHCLKTKNGFRIKDLNMILDRNSEDMVVVDNYSYSFGSAFENGIPILPWYDDEHDKELRYLTKYLIKAAF